MNSMFKVLFVCILAALFSNGVQSRSLQRLGSKRAEESKPLCNLIVAIMNGIIHGAKLDLTPEQQELLHKPEVSRRNADEECAEEKEKWFLTMTPFLSSLTQEQVEKLMGEFSKFTQETTETHERLLSIKRMVDSAKMWKRKAFNNYRY